MKYIKPQITNLKTASVSIMGNKAMSPVTDGIGHTTQGAYSADE